MNNICKVKPVDKEIIFVREEKSSNEKEDTKDREEEAECHKKPRAVTNCSKKVKRISIIIRR